MPGVDEQQRRVVARHERASSATCVWPLRDEVIDEPAADVGDLHGGRGAGSVDRRRDGPGKTWRGNKRLIVACGRCGNHRATLLASRQDCRRARRRASVVARAAQAGALQHRERGGQAIAARLQEAHLPRLFALVGGRLPEAPLPQRERVRELVALGQRRQRAASASSVRDARAPSARARSRACRSAPCAARRRRCA